MPAMHPKVLNQFNLRHSEQNVPLIKQEALLIQNTYWGSIASLELDNTSMPGKWKAYARCMYKMFEKGVVFLNLQKVPAPSSDNFKTLFDELTTLNKDSNLIDLEMLKRHWCKTGMKHGEIELGLAAICNPRFFTMTKCDEMLQAQDKNRAPVKDMFRGCQYSVTALSSKDTFHIANIYGAQTIPNQIQTILFQSQFIGIITGVFNIEGNFNTPMPTNTFQGFAGGTPKRYLNFINDTISQKKSAAYIPSSTEITPAIEEPSTPVVFATEASSFRPITLRIHAPIKQAIEEYSKSIAGRGEAHPKEAIEPFTVTGNLLTLNTLLAAQEFLPICLANCSKHAELESAAKKRSEEMAKKEAIAKQAEEAAKREAEAAAAKEREEELRITHQVFRAIEESMLVEAQQRKEPEKEKQEAFKSSPVDLEREAQRIAKSVKEQTEKEAVAAGIELTPEEFNKIQCDAMGLLAQRHAAASKGQTDPFVRNTTQTEEIEIVRAAIAKIVAERAQAQEADRLAIEQARQKEAAAEQPRQRQEEVERLAAEQERQDAQLMEELNALDAQWAEKEREKEAATRLAAEQARKEEVAAAHEATLNFRQQTAQYSSPKAPSKRVIRDAAHRATPFNPFKLPPLNEANKEIIDVIECIIENIKGVNDSTRVSWYDIRKANKIELLTLVQEYLKHRRPLSAEKRIEVFALIRDICAIKRNFLSPLFNTAAAHSLGEFEGAIKDVKDGKALLDVKEYEQYEKHSFEEKKIKAIKTVDDVKALLFKDNAAPVVAVQ